MKMNTAWAVENVNDILLPAPLRLEMGIERDENGLLTVAVRTDLHGCKGRMVEWWFTFLKQRSTSAGGIPMTMLPTMDGMTSGKKGKVILVHQFMRLNH